MKKFGVLLLIATLLFVAVAPAAAHHGGPRFHGYVFVDALLAPLFLPFAVAATITTGIAAAVTAPFTYPYAPYSPAYAPLRLRSAAIGPRARVRATRPRSAAIGPCARVRATRLRSAAIGPCARVRATPVYAAPPSASAPAYAPPVYAAPPSAPTPRTRHPSTQLRHRAPPRLRTGTTVRARAATTRTSARAPLAG